MLRGAAARLVGVEAASSTSGCKPSSLPARDLAAPLPRHRDISAKLTALWGT